MPPTNSSSPAKRRTRARLTRDAIVGAAIELADTEGVDALTMRKVAASLGYEVMSLYNHLTNKRDLLDSMVESVVGDVLAQIGSVDTAECDPDGALDALRELILALRMTLVDHPWAVELWLRHMPGPARSQLMEAKLALLARSGLDPDLAHHGFHAVTNHLIGYCLQEIGMVAGMSDLGADVDAITTEYLDSLNNQDHAHVIAHVHQHIRGESTSSFELVLDLILDGLVSLDPGRGRR